MNNELAFAMPFLFAFSFPRFLPDKEKQKEIGTNIMRYSLCNRKCVFVQWCAFAICTVDAVHRATYIQFVVLMHKKMYRQLHVFHIFQAVVCLVVSFARSLSTITYCMSSTFLGQ